MVLEYSGDNTVPRRVVVVEAGSDRTANMYCAREEWPTSPRIAVTCALVLRVSDVDLLQQNYLID